MSRFFILRKIVTWIAFVAFVAASFVLVRELEGINFSLSAPTVNRTVNTFSTSRTFSTAVPGSQPQLVKVVRVIDGDTIELGGGEKMRYIGIDAPETVDPRRPMQCFGSAATARNRELVEGKLVRISKDVSDRDQYGRLLRYVYVYDQQGNEVLVNFVLVQEGFAHASAHPPDVKLQSLLEQAQENARTQKVGLWKQCLEL